MFEEIEKAEPQLKDEKRTTWAGVITGLCTLPVYFTLTYFGHASLGLCLSVSIVAIGIAIYTRWSLRKHAWFWVSIAPLVALNIYLATKIQVPDGTNDLVLKLFMVPAAVVDYALALVCIRMVEIVMVKKFPRRED